MIQYRSISPEQISSAHQRIAQANFESWIVLERYRERACRFYTRIGSNRGIPRAQSCIAHKTTPLTRGAGMHVRAFRCIFMHPVGPLDIVPVGQACRVLEVYLWGI